MIIVRAPLRVSLCGGGSDLPTFYEKYGGCVISTTIKKYVYLTLNPAFYRNDIVLKYSKTEVAHDYTEIEHSIFRDAFRRFDIKGVEIASMADVPSGTGLGSSSAFTVALLKLLYTYNNQHISTYKVAKEACEIEIEDLKNPIGKQDQFASAFGGLKYYEFQPNGFVKVEPIVMLPESFQKLEDNLMLFYTGIKHDASKILSEQSKNLASDPEKEKATLALCELTRELKEHLEENDVDFVGDLLNRAWKIKKQLAKSISGCEIDQYYDLAIQAGAMGGKLLGAGGGGFLLFYVKPEQQESVRQALINLKEMNFEIDNSGVSILYDN